MYSLLGSMQRQRLPFFVWGIPGIVGMVKHNWRSETTVFIFEYLFIWLHWALVAARRIADLFCGMWTLSCSMLYLVPQPEIEHQPPALGVQSLSHWTSREVLESVIFKLCWCCLVAQSCPTLLWTPGLQPSRLPCPWSFPGNNTGLGCHFPLQGLFLTQGSNPHLLHWQVGSLQTSHQGGQQRGLQSLLKGLLIARLLDPTPKNS